MSFYRFLKRIGLVVNPTLVESEIYCGSYRNPSPASQVPVKAKAELPKLTNTYYYERDERRQYPQTLTFTNALQLPASDSQVKPPGLICVPPSLHTHKWHEANDSNFPSPDEVYFPIKMLK